jgi:hypothetical protein
MASVIARNAPSPSPEAASASSSNAISAARERPKAGSPRQAQRSQHERLGVAERARPPGGLVERVPGLGIARGPHRRGAERGQTLSRFRSSGACGERGQRALVVCDRSPYANNATACSAARSEHSTALLAVPSGAART